MNRAELLAALAAFPDRLAVAARGASARPMPPGEWGPVEVVRHLIAVEAEMNKVSWPSRTELIRASLVVLFVVFLLATVLFLYDLAWLEFFEWLGIQGSGVGNG
mgnify:CR=1 FL=1